MTLKDQWMLVCTTHMLNPIRWCCPAGTWTQTCAWTSKTDNNSVKRLWISVKRHRKDNTKSSFSPSEITKQSSWILILLDPVGLSRIALKSHDSLLEDYSELSARKDTGLATQLPGWKTFKPSASLPTFSPVIARFNGGMFILEPSESKFQQLRRLLLGTSMSTVAELFRDWVTIPALEAKHVKTCYDVQAQTNRATQWWLWRNSAACLERLYVLTNSRCLLTPNKWGRETTKPFESVNIARYFLNQAFPSCEQQSEEDVGCWKHALAETCLQRLPGTAENVMGL